MADGMIGHIGIGLESTWGTGVAATDYLVAMSEGLTLTKERFEVSNIAGRYSETDDMEGVETVAGDIVFPAHPNPLGHFLKGVMGTHSGSVVLSGFLWLNEYTLETSNDSADAPYPPYSLEIFRDVTSSNQYTGCQINGLAFSVAPNQDVRMTANIMGKATSVIAKTTPSYVGSPVNPFAFDTASIELGGSASAIVETLDINIQNNLVGVSVLNNSTEIARFRRSGAQTVRVSGTVGFDNLTEYTNFINNTEQQLIATFTRTDSFALTIDLPRIVYTAFPLGIGGKERLTVGFEATARHHVGSAQAIKIDLTNTKSNY